MTQVRPSSPAAQALFRAFAWLQVLALNAVPLYGVYVLGWPWGTVLVLYWCETVLGTLFIALRMSVHWNLTHDRGYSRPLFGTAPGKSRFGAFLFDFTAASLFASFVPGIFLAVILGLMLKGQPAAAIHLPALQKGLAAIALIMIGSFALDCQNLRHRPFEWISALAQRSLGRIIVINLAILFGMLGIARSEASKAPFVVFAAVKLLVELGTLYGGLEARPVRPAPAETIGGIAPVAEKASREKKRGVHGRTRGR